MWRRISIVMLALLPAAASAQSEPAARGRAIEEIIVTAQKTAENVREVPISMSVLSDDFIAQQNITDYRDLALFTPNAHVDPGNGLFPDINVRGFGSALSNKAFEQSVGLAIDGVPYGRTPYFQGPLFDIQRVELLRGPQGTLFGKNTTAGLLNVVTKKPTDEYTGDLDVELGELNTERFEVALGGPLVRGLVNFRLSGLTDTRDGIVRNTTVDVRPDANARMNDRERNGIRFQLGFPNLAGGNLVVGYEHVDFDFHGIGWEFDRIPDRTRSFYRQFDPNTDFTPRNFVGSVDTPEFNKNRMDTVVVNASYPIGRWELAAVGGYSILKDRSLTDDDFGPEPFTFNTSGDDNPQTTAEVRLTSPGLLGFLGLARIFGLPLGTSDFTLGFFYQRRQIENSELSIHLNLPVFAQFVVAQGLPLSAVGGLPATPLIPAGIIPPLDPIYAMFPTLASLQNQGVGEAVTEDLFGQKTRSLAGFGQLNWHFYDRFTLLFGGRIADEQKSAHWHRTFSPVTGLAFVALGGEEFTTSRERSELQFTPKVALRYDWSDDVAVYASWSKGYKAGGFNEQAYNNADKSLQFEPEKATAYEVGTKLTLLDGTAAVNVALFYQDVTNFQVFTLPPNSVATTVVNAGEARAQGVELDTTWLPTSWLTLNGTLGYNDSKFLSFVFGQCSFDRPDTDGNGDGRCDHTGQPLVRTPKWDATLVPNARWPLDSLGAKAFDLLAGGSAEYQDVQFLQRTYDERVRQSPFFRFGANVGIGQREQHWSLRLNVYNLTNRNTGVVIMDVPFGGGNFARIPEPPRLVFGSFRWTF